MARALGAFRQCHDERRAADAQTWLTNVRLRRSCWMCHREFQGAGTHFSSYPSLITPHMVDTVRALGQDESAMHLASAQIVLCAACGKALERQADRYAVTRTGELAGRVDSQVAELQRAIQTLSAAVQHLQRSR